MGVLLFGIRVALNHRLVTLANGAFTVVIDGIKLAGIAVVLVVLLVIDGFAVLFPGGFNTTSGVGLLVVVVSIHHTLVSGPFHLVVASVVVGRMVVGALVVVTGGSGVFVNTLRVVVSVVARTITGYCSVRS